MTGKHLFISYSRREYHFTESLTLHLQRAGIDVWFDNQQIRPGEDWRADIQAGLDRSDAIILVASKSSLASPYVRDEYNHALENGKPIYVAVFETIQLSDALSQAAAVIDFRTHFDKAVTALLECLWQDAIHLDPITPSGPRWLLKGIPRGVARVQLALYVNFFAWVMIFTYYALIVSSNTNTNSPATLRFDLLCCLTIPSAILLVLGWRIMFLWRRLILRTFSIQQIRWTLIWVFLLQLLTDLRIWVANEFRPIELLILAVCVPSSYLLYRLWANADFLRWCPLGDDVTDWRVQVNHPLLPSTASPLPPIPLKLDNKLDMAFQMSASSEPDLIPSTVKSYRLHYFPGDEGLANEVREVLHTVGWNEVDTGAPDYHLLLLNAWTPQLIIDSVGVLPNLICILASSIGQSDQWTSLKALQWIDYRTRSQHALWSAFRMMNAANLEERALSGLNAQPAQLSEFIIAPELKPIYRWIRWTAIWSLAVATSTLLQLRSHTDPIAAIITVLNLLIFIVGIYLFRLADRIIALRPPPIRLTVLGLVPLVVLVIQTTLLNLFYWEFKMTLNGALLSRSGLFLGTLPLIALWVWIGWKFWIAAKKLETRGLLASAPRINSTFRTPVKKSAATVMGCLLIYELSRFLLPVFGSPSVLIVMGFILFAIYMRAQSIWNVVSRWLQRLTPSGWTNWNEKVAFSMLVKKEHRPE